MATVPSKYNPIIIRSNREQITRFSTKKSYSALTGIYSSSKNDRLIYFESSLERDFAKLSEFDDQVKRYIDHPITIGYTWKGKDYSYTPDFMVEFSSKSILKKDRFLGETVQTKKWIVELKPEKMLAKLDDLDRAKFEAASEFCSLNGSEFHIFSENIRGAYLNNIEKLLPLVSEEVDKNLSQQILRHFVKTELKIAELIDRFDLEQHGSIIRSIWVLIAQKKLKCDLTQPITKNTLIYHDSKV